MQSFNIPNRWALVANPAGARSESVAVATYAPTKQELLDMLKNDRLAKMERVGSLFLSYKADSPLRYFNPLGHLKEDDHGNMTDYSGCGVVDLCYPHWFVAKKLGLSFDTIYALREKFEGLEE